MDRTPGPVALAVCHGYGCAWRDYVTLSEAQWHGIRETWRVPAATPQSERVRIADAIGDLERMVGARIGTSADRPGTPFSWGNPSQLDCVDESINTSTYLHLLANAGLLRFHAVDEIRRRTGFLRLSQHYTAVIRESATGVRFAVDSWFHENGRPAEIVPLEQWLAGWEPGGETSAVRH